MTKAAVVHLASSNDAENVAMVRHVITGIADSVNLPERLTDDIKTAVSEACANVVLHAYRGEPGPLGVTIGVDDSGLTVIVRDRGEGIKPRRGNEEQRVRGVGLSLIQTLTDSVEFRGAPREGTEVRMNFLLDPDAASGAREDGSALSEEALEELPPSLEAGTVVEVSPGQLAAPVLASVIAVLAARASFSVERLADAQLVTDTIAAHSDGMLAGPYLTMGIDSGDDELDMRLGPLQSGDAMRLVGATEVGEIKPLKVLTDELRAAPGAADEYLRIRMKA
jgi:anti-sigma regulatory factor (Ser/Thr protein kinase)